MKKITKYRADDGTEFNSEAEAVNHDALCLEIKEVMSELPKRPSNGCKFENGEGFIQHQPHVFFGVRHALLAIGKRYIELGWIDQAIKDRNIHPSWVIRLFDERCPALSRAWYRIMCTDKKLREWGQPYFADHPDEASGKFEICTDQEAESLYD